MVDVAIELSTVCNVAGWNDAAPFAGEDTVTLKPDGRVLFLHERQELELGRVTPEQYARLMMGVKQ